MQPISHPFANIKVIELCSKAFAWSERSFSLSAGEKRQFYTSGSWQQEVSRWSFEEAAQKKIVNITCFFMTAFIIRINLTNIKNKQIYVKSCYQYVFIL